MITIQQLELWGRTDPLIAGIYATQALSHIGGRYIQDGRIMEDSFTISKDILTTVLEARWAVKSCGLNDPRWMERRPICNFEGKRTDWLRLFTKEVALASGVFEQEALITNHNKLVPLDGTTVQIKDEQLVIGDRVMYQFGYYAGEV